VEELLTEKELASLLKVSARTLRAWRDAGEGPPAIKIGRRAIRYRRSDVERWLEQQRESE
jgi:excisionase family DNA binding protein